MDPKEIAACDVAYWATLNRLRLGSGYFTLEGHGYQLEPLQSRAKKVCYMKGTQLGFTEIEILKSLHGMLHGRYPLGVLYIFPTADDVGEFSKSRFGPLIRANPESIGRYVRSQKDGTDTTSLKRIGDAFLYLRGARLTAQVEGGEKESVKLRSIPVDRVVLDEMDLMDERVLAMARSRMGHSSVKEEVLLGNPTLPDYGIDKVYQDSDRRHWFRRCGCGGWTSAELSFPDCVHRDKETGKGYIACGKCGKAVGTRGKNEWVPEYPGKEYPGLQLSQLSSEYNDPWQILEEFQNPPEGNLADVYRLRLGLPYVAAEDRLTQAEVLECCGGSLAAVGHPGPCAMGVDVGKTKHVVIGVRTGRDRYEVVRLARVEAWEDIAELARRYGVRSSVLDLRPYEDEVRRYQREEPYRIYLCEYGEQRSVGTEFNDATGIVRVNRTEICDATHRLITERRVVLPREGTEVKEFARQMANAAKVLEENKRTGRAVYRYRTVGTGGDHYRHALNYFLLAASGTRVARSAAAGERPRRAKNEFRLAGPHRRRMRVAV